MAISDGRRPYRRCRGRSRRRIPAVSPSKRLVHSENLRKANPIQISTTHTVDAQISCCLINTRSSLPLDFCLLNIRSVNRDGEELVDLVTKYDMDMVALTETYM